MSNAQQLQVLVQQDPLKAIEEIDKTLLTQNPTNPNTYNFHLLRGQAYLNPKALNYVEAGVSADNAIAIVEGLKKNENSLPEQTKKSLPQLMGIAYQLKGQCEMGLEHFSKAAEAFQRAYDSFETLQKNPAIITNMGKCYLKSDPPNKEQAIIYLKKSIEINPDSEAGIIAIGEVGNLLDEEKQYEEALKYYKMGIKTCEEKKQNDKLLLLYTNKGNVEKNLSNFDEAIKSFERALELKPQHQNAVDGLSLVSYNKMVQEASKKNYSETLIWSEKVLQYKPQDPEALFCKALALDNLGKKDESIVAYQEVIKVNPERLDALLNLGTILHGKRLFSEAIEYYEQANRIEAKPETYNNLGEAYKELNRFNEAFQAYDLAIQNNPNNVVALCNRAQLNLKKGNKQLAMDDLKQIDILIQDPHNTKDLREKTLNYIKGSVKQILEIEKAFEREKKAFEEQMKLQDQSDPEVLKILQQMEEIQKQKDLQSEQALNGVNKPDGAQGKMTSISEIQLQVKKLMEDLANITKQKEELVQEIVQEEKKIEEIKQEVDEQTELLNLVGADKAAKVKTTYQAWSASGIRNDNDKYDYSKAFYWTFINYCDAQRIANTGVIKTDANSAVDSTTQTAVKVTGAVLDFASGVPIFGSIFGALKSAVDGLYKAYSEKQEEDKRMAILKVIQENQDAQDQQEWSMLVALAAQEIAVRKTLVFDEKHEEKLHPKPKGTLDKITSWISEKVDQIKAAAFGEKVDLYENVGGEEAVADMIILLAFIQKNYREMIHHRSQRLDKTIADIVYNNGGITPEFQSMLDAIDVREEQENPGKKAQTERTDQSCACNLI